MSLTRDRINRVGKTERTHAHCVDASTRTQFGRMSYSGHNPATARCIACLSRGCHTTVGARMLQIGWPLAILGLLQWYQNIQGSSATARAVVRELTFFCGWLGSVKTSSWVGNKKGVLLLFAHGGIDGTKYELLHWFDEMQQFYSSESGHRRIYFVQGNIRPSSRGMFGLAPSNFQPQPPFPPAPPTGSSYFCPIPKQTNSVATQIVTPARPRHCTFP